MKKIFTLLFCLMSVVSMYSQDLFSTSFATEEEFNAWTVVDANGDEKTWKFDSSGSPSKVFYSYSGANAADDWMISPAVVAPKDGVMAVLFTVKGSSYVEKMEVMYGSSATVEAMVNRGTEVTSYLDTESGGYFLIPVKAGESYNLGFHAVSDADKWRLYLCSVTVKVVDNPVDLLVSEVVSPVDGEGLSQETVKAKVKNTGMAAANGFKIGFSVDGDTVAVEECAQSLAAGAEMEYTFAAKADLSGPRKKYAVKVWVEIADDVNPANNATEVNVVHSAPASVPYYMGFEYTESTDGFKFFNLNEDDGDWQLYSDPWWNLARTGTVCLAYNYNKYNPGDDWAILDPIEIKEAGYYALKFWYATDNSYAESFGVYYGAEQKVEAMTNKIVELKKVANSTYQECISIIYLDKPQTLCLGFYSFTDKNLNWITVDDLSFEKIDADNVDLQMGAITNPGAYVHKKNSKDVKFSVRSLAIKDVAANVKLMIDEKVVSEANETIKAQEIKQYVLTNKLEGLSEGVHTLKAIVTSSDDTNAANDTVSLEFRVLGEAALLWDFEDGKVPADFTMRSEDEGTINSGAGEEFNEYGWGIFNIQNHAQFGEHVFAGTTWLDGVEKANRWCVLPQVKVTSENSFFVWDVASYNPNFLEDYRVKISTDKDDDWDYWTKMEVVAESPEFKTRGLDLSEYVDKTIYIAFQLVSKNCESLILDNVGLYGSFELVTTSVEETMGEVSLKVAVENGVMKANKEVDTMTLLDMSGKVVASTTESEMSVSEVAAGVYVAKVVSGTEIVSKKVVIK